jgi:hypothetical protein
MSDKKQDTGSDKLPNNFNDGSGYSRSKSNAPKISGSSGGNATGPALTENRGKQGNG